jgi:2'-5' RNA ligase
MSFRGFIAADLPPVPNLEAIVCELRKASRDLKVVSAEHLHLTLKFLGDTEEGLVPEIVSAMRDACTGIAPFFLRIRGTGAFPSLSRPNVLWVGVEGGDPLARIAKLLNDDLVALGFEREGRGWSPHVTLARVRGRQGLDRALGILRDHEHEIFAEPRIEEIHLKKSALRPEGPEYTTLESIRFKG